MVYNLGYTITYKAYMGMNPFRLDTSIYHQLTEILLHCLFMLYADEILLCRKRLPQNLP